MEENKILEFWDIEEMLTGRNPIRYRNIGNIKWVKTWKENESDTNSTIYAIGQLKNGKYFWGWDLKPHKQREWKDILKNLDDCANDKWYGCGGFIDKTLTSTLKSIQFDDIFEEELLENEGLTSEQWKDHPFYLWAKEQFEIV
jgi:hypothetical protein